uniref:Uncharacterized protein n=1 Tax=Meloidogyne enterolobii TaxID=390850 RepID=A0A6V7UPS4_MELEN|nr:unnamed protein product [Meloidogyne enterolobii]
MSLIFWPITDQADVDSEEDWVCCGIMHAFFGSMLFMFGELTKFPTMLFIYKYIYEFSILPTGFFKVGFINDEFIQWIMFITVLPGIVAYLRILLCLYSHVCAEWHHKLAITCMAIYFVRTLLFTLYALIITINAFQLIWGKGFIDGFQQAATYAIWLTITFDYAIGSYLSYLSLDFMMLRYRRLFFN